MIEKKLYKIVAACVIIMFLFPIYKIGKTTSFKLDWLFTKAIVFILLLSFERLIRVKLYRQLFVILILISIGYILSNYVGGSLYAWNSNYGFPIYIGIIDRVSVFVFFSFIVYKNIYSFKDLKKLISIVFLLALIFGIAQFFDLFNSKEIALKYYLDAESVQGYNFLKFNRILGVAPAIITWGGLCVLICHYFLFVEESKLFKYIGVVFAILNVLVSGSRAAITSLFISLVLIYIIKAVLIDKKLGSFLKIMSGLSIAFFGAFFLFKTYMPLQLEFLLKRFDRAEAALTTQGRGSQMSYFRELFAKKPIGIFIGTGDQAIKEYGYLEVDYAYLFVAYGVFSFILHYTLLYLLLKKAYKLRYLNNRLFLFIWGSTIGYLIFSFGFFFFKELYTGMVFWWVNGAVLGYLWVLKKQNDVYIKKHI